MNLDIFFNVEEGIAFAIEENIAGVSDAVVLFSVEYCLDE